MDRADRLAAPDDSPPADRPEILPPPEKSFGPRGFAVDLGERPHAKLRETAVTDDEAEAEKDDLLRGAAAADRAAFRRIYRLASAKRPHLAANLS